MKTKPNHSDGARWKGDWDKRVYTMATKNGVRGFRREGTGYDGKLFESHSSLRMCFNAENGYTFLGNVAPPTKLDIAKDRIAELEGLLKTAAEDKESIIASHRTNTEYYSNRMKATEEALQNARREAEANARAAKFANASIVAMKRQIELMGEALKVSQSAVVA